MEDFHRQFEQRFQQITFEIAKKEQNHITYMTSKENLVSLCQYIYNNNSRFITMVGTDEREMNDYFSLYYVFAFDQKGIFVTVQTTIQENDPTFPSVTKEIPVCDWYEREVYDLLGLEPIDHPNLHSLILHDNWPEGHYPLRKDYNLKEKQPYEKSQDWFATQYEGEGITKIPVGPIHAGIIEPGHFLFGVAGDVILNLDAQLFFKHRGLEKSSENLSLTEGVLLAERICGNCSLSHAVSYCLAIEQLTETIVPKRAQKLRMIYLELERLYNHIGDIGDLCSGAGFHLGANHGARLKEYVHQLNEQIVGHRFLRGTVTLGGVRQDPRDYELTFLRSRLSRIRHDFLEVVQLILDHEITVERMTNTGILKK